MLKSIMLAYFPTNKINVWLSRQGNLKVTIPFSTRWLFDMYELSIRLKILQNLGQWQNETILYYHKHLMEPKLSEKK